MPVSPEGKSAKQGGGGATTVTPTLKKTFTVSEQRYDECWEEGESIPLLKKNLGADVYEAMLRAGDLTEKKNDGGRMMAYIYKDFRNTPSGRQMC